jgi:hypothetical protein
VQQQAPSRCCYLLPPLLSCHGKGTCVAAAAPPPHSPSEVLVEKTPAQVAITVMCVSQLSTPSWMVHAAMTRLINTVKRMHDLLLCFMHTMQQVC